jgi:hypothetical protein
MQQFDAQRRFQFLNMLSDQGFRNTAPFGGERETIGIDDGHKGSHGIQVAHEVWFLVCSVKGLFTKRHLIDAAN